MFQNSLLIFLRWSSDITVEHFRLHALLHPVFTVYFCLWLLVFKFARSARCAMLNRWRLLCLVWMSLLFICGWLWQPDSLSARLLPSTSLCTVFEEISLNWASSFPTAFGTADRSLSTAVRSEWSDVFCPWLGASVAKSGMLDTALKLSVELVCRLLVAVTFLGVEWIIGLRQVMACTLWPTDSLEVGLCNNVDQMLWQRMKAVQ